MRFKPLPVLAALALLPASALAQSDATGDEDAGAAGSSLSEPAREDTGLGGQGDVSLGTPESGSLANVVDDDVIGKTVVSEDGAQIGEVEDVIRSPDGQNLLIVTTSGLLGDQGHNVAVQADQAQYDEENQAVTLSMSQDEVINLPEYGIP
jgi:hypothetical protein